MVAHKLKIMQHDVVSNMSVDELHGWVAYFSLQDDDYRKEIEDKVQVEKPAEQQLDDIERLLMGLGTK